MNKNANKKIKKKKNQKKQKNGGKSPASHRHQRETVRPIFWSNRNESYLRRTQHWDEFPNGRWGDNRSPAYGEFPHHHLLHHQRSFQSLERRKMWGEKLDSVNDVCEVFVGYLDSKVETLPWCVEAIKPETCLMYV